MTKKTCPWMMLVDCTWEAAGGGQVEEPGLCSKEQCELWEEMADSCSFKAGQRHTRALSVGFTELGMALIDVLREMREEEGDGTG